jgi:hypothetical protein
MRLLAGLLFTAITLGTIEAQTTCNNAVAECTPKPPCAPGSLGRSYCEEILSVYQDLECNSGCGYEAVTKTIDNCTCNTVVNGFQVGCFSTYYPCSTLHLFQPPKQRKQLEMFHFEPMHHPNYQRVYQQWQLDTKTWWKRI